MFEKKTELTNFDDVGEFHEKFGLDNTTHQDIGVRNVPSDVLGYRMNFILEELRETVGALGGHFEPEYDQAEIELDQGIPSLIGLKVVIPPDTRVNHAEAFDGLLDMAYVIFGTAHFLGYPWQQGWRLVHRANMSKIRAKRDGSDSTRGHALDVVKPEGFQPPNIARLLNRFGWINTGEAPHAPSCTEVHPITENSCVVEGPHEDHRAMGTERMQVFGPHLAEAVAEDMKDNQ